MRAWGRLLWVCKLCGEPSLRPNSTDSRKTCDSYSEEFATLLFNIVSRFSWFSHRQNNIQVKIMLCSFLIPLWLRTWNNSFGLELHTCWEHVAPTHSVFTIQSNTCIIGCVRVWISTDVNCCCTWDAICYCTEYYLWMSLKPYLCNETEHILKLLNRYRYIRTNATHFVAYYQKLFIQTSIYWLLS